MKTAKRILIGIMALGLLGAFCIISTCDYEDYCKNHGVECETETNPLTALIPAAVVALAGAGVAYIERKEDANNDR